MKTKTINKEMFTDELSVMLNKVLHAEHDSRCADNADTKKGRELTKFYEGQAEAIEQVFEMLRTNPKFK